MAFEIIECPGCGTRVVPTTDGTCPACRKNTQREVVADSPGSIESSGESENPYASPRHGGRGDDAIRSRIRPLAVLTGWLFDTVLTMMVFSVPAFIRISNQINMVEPLNWMILALVVLGGTACSIAGGYLSAWMGQTLPIGHGFAVGIMSLLTNAFFCLPDFRSDYAAPWINTVCFFVALPAAVSGAYLHGRRSQQHSSEISEG